MSQLQINIIIKLAHELAIRDCPRQELSWKPRGGCNISCERVYNESKAAQCWIEYATEKVK